MILNINYVVKETNANTEYRLMNKSSMNKLLEYCKLITSVVENKDTSDFPLLTESNPHLPRMRTGSRNSPYTLCQGIIDNISSDQYNLTKKQCDGLIECFRVANSCINEFPTLTFTPVDTLTIDKLSAEVKKEDQAVTIAIPIDSKYTIEQITVVYKPKD